MLRIGCLGDVRVQLPGEPAERTLYLVTAGVPRHPEQFDGAENAVRQPVRGAHEGDVLERRMLEIAADTHERPPRVERLPEDLEQSSALLQRGEHSAVEDEILVGNLVEKPCGVADEE